MSRKNSNKRYTKAQIQARIEAKKKAKRLAMQKHITIFTLLALLVIGLVSTTFASFASPAQTGESGSLVAQIKTNAVNNGSKDHIAQTAVDNDLSDTSANVDVATSGASLSKGDVIWYSGSKTHIYVWEDSSNTNAAAWPGEALKTDATSGLKYWISDSDTPFDMCIFSNNGGDQSADLAIGGAGYVHNSSGSTGVFYSNEVSENNIRFDLLPVLDGTSIMFYIGEPSSWGQSTFYLRSGAGGSTVDSGSSVVTYNNNKYAVVTAPSKTGYYVSHSTSWDGEKLNSAPKSGVAYLCNNNDSTSGCATSGSQYTVTATLAKSTITVGDTVNISSSSKSNGNLGRTTSFEYYAKSSNGAYKKLSFSGSVLDTSDLAAGAYTIYPVLTDGYVYTRGSGVTLNVVSTYSYTISAAYGGSASPESGTVTIGDSVSITATPNTGYTFAEWTNLSKATIGNANSATTSLTPTADSATVMANFRPNAPTALNLTASNMVGGTGTQNDPYIVFVDRDFSITASVPSSALPTGSTAFYNSTNNSAGSTSTGTFAPTRTTKGTVIKYDVYAWAKTGSYYSSSSKSASAYYLVFNHLDGANTSFSVSDYEITDVESVTLSASEVTGVDTAEKTYITQTYQVSSNNSTFTDLSSDDSYTWKPDTIGTYYFRVKTTNTKTRETVYSSSQSVTVTQSEVYYSITVTKDNGSANGTVTLKTGNTTITDNKILSNSPLTITIARPSTNTSNYYVDYLNVDGTAVKTDVNGNVTYTIDHVKGDVVINYKIVTKPTVAVTKDSNATIKFIYYSDGVTKEVTAAGAYYVDYNTSITYAVTPNTGYYVKSMTGVQMVGEVSASTATGTAGNVIADISSVSAEVVNNNTITVNISPNATVTEGASMTIDGAAHPFGSPKPLNYGVYSEIVITPPDGYYASINGGTISTDGKATLKVRVKGNNVIYSVNFVKNPKIYMVQPRYGSVYVTDDLGNYYFNGDSVGYGTKLTVHVKPDHANATLSNVFVNDASIGTADGSTFIIKTDSTVSATITVSDDFAFAENAGTEYGTRRIFFTDTCAWGNSNASNVLVHYSNTLNDTNFSSNNITMTRKYYNEYSQYVYYADIPFSAKYVTFVNAANKAQYSAQGIIASTNNAYYMGNTGNYPRAISSWTLNYSDYNATDRADTIMQATTSKGNAATFQYTCDFGDGALSAEVVSGNAATFDFDKGVLSITPTDNSKPYTLVKVTSAASGTVKYYLVRVENFEIYSFSGLQKIYSTSVVNKIQLDLILKGGVLNYAAKLFVSDTNATGSYTEQTAVQSGFTQLDSLEGYINSFLLQYEINTISGVKYYKVDAKDGANRSATTTAKTLFGTHSYNGEDVLYFYNDTNVNMGKFKLRACFMDTNNDNKTFVTMQRVGNTDYYRAVVPDNAGDKVNFYLTNPKTFSNNYADYDGNYDSTDFYSYCAFGVVIPKDTSTDSNADVNIVYKATSVDSNGIVGEFVNFDY